MADIRSLIESDLSVREIIEASYTGVREVRSWISPEGEEIKIGDRHHGEYVLFNTEEFGLERKDLTTSGSRGDPTTSRNIVRTAIKKGNDGWVAISRTPGSVNVTGTEESIRKHADVIMGGSDKAYFVGYPEGGGEKFDNLKEFLERYG